MPFHIDLRLVGAAALPYLTRGQGGGAAPTSAMISSQEPPGFAAVEVDPEAEQTAWQQLASSTLAGRAAGN